MTRDYRLMGMIRTLLENRRFFVELGGKRSRWRSQRNGLPQGSVLAPLLFNVYTNDQPIHPGTRSFVYADDLAVATQSTDFAPIEETLTSALDGLSEYYTSNQLRANPMKTQVSLFHLRNRDCGKQLNISWNGATSQCILASLWTERCRIKHISRRPKRKSEQETTSSANYETQNGEPLQPHSGRPL